MHPIQYYVQKAHTFKKNVNVTVIMTVCLTGTVISTDYGDIEKVTFTFKRSELHCKICLGAGGLRYEHLCQ